MLVRAPDALRADLQHYYRLDLDQLGRTLRVRRAADLAANLPEQARVWARLDPALAWDARTRLLAMIADCADFVAWTRSAASQEPGARWESRISRPGDGPERKKGGDAPASLSIGELEERLAVPQEVISSNDSRTTA